MYTLHRNRPEIPEPVPSSSQHGAEFGGLWLFPVIKIIMVRQVSVLSECTAVWEWWQTSAKMLHGVWRSWTHLFCVYFCMCGWQKPEDPKIEPHSWQCHYTGLYRLFSLLAIILRWGPYWGGDAQDVINLHPSPRFGLDLWTESEG